jgi:hypothetical protein
VPGTKDTHHADNNGAGAGQEAEDQTLGERAILDWFAGSLAFFKGVEGLRQEYQDGR